MKLLFNKADQGQEEIKELLGFINRDLKYKNLVSDIELQTPLLIDFISKPVYDKIEEFYQSEQTGENAEIMKVALKTAQLYILLQAYLQYAPNADVMHTTSGRNVQMPNNSKMAWDWMLKKDEVNTERRSYRALDALIQALDEMELAEWIASEEYKTAQGLFITRTNQFQKIYPIENSGQLYYRMVPFMSDIEAETLIPILGVDKIEELKIDLNAGTFTPDGQLILYCRKIVGFHAMSRALTLLPDEMLPFKYNVKMKTEDLEALRESRSAKFKGMAEDFEKLLEQIFAGQNEVEYETDQLYGIKDGKKHVNL
ncbi:hypothetical protein JM79_3240 [Gramella sp. Hel_I_59]|uniref:DUF6712 family protein n=1 Tax=Gramella sp. Hel_I_59 TaxID=1249978 RepID=UPI0011526526|nr:DUF6712 family protein [Gramella sp. Hel_I_59]TQI72282.1 hypothetical protein JM79_3240 [Gramella sp. Hel_I_59]